MGSNQAWVCLHAGMETTVRKRKMTKKIEELKQPKKEVSLELAEFLKEMHEASVKNIEDLKKQLIEIEAEILHRRSQGENI